LLLPLAFTMEFISINEYFYKLFSRLMLILLFPIVTFIAIYLQPLIIPIDIETYTAELMLVITMVMSLWLFVFIFFNKKIKTVRNGQGLREKLEKYFRITIVRYSIFSLVSLTLAVAFYFSRNDMFTVFFVAQLILCGLVWPFSSKVSNDLKLRGDEREMVYYKKDTLG
jgi:hypothetical protein